MRKLKKENERRKKIKIKNKMFLSKRLNSVNHWWFLICLNVCYGFYLPGLAPVNYCRESEASSQCKVSENDFFWVFLCLNSSRFDGQSFNACGFYGIYFFSNEFYFVFFFGWFVNGNPTHVLRSMQTFIFFCYRLFW